jgi:glycerol uptake facilitator-like aquaporin
MKAYLAELVGTFVLVSVLAGDRIGFAGIACAFGLSLLAMVYAVGQYRAATSIPRSPSASISAASSRVAESAGTW